MNRLLFLYGTLRIGSDDPMAHWLHGVARLIGPGWAKGTIYRVDTYPGFVPGGAARVVGDLVRLDDPQAAFAILDEHEQCSDAWPHPHEYRREQIAVTGPQGLVEAWTYIFAHDVSALERIESGDFLG
jgi:gamma-glutamylcyclotransferase (GGCT)/AIG2-like uncharacterized protein YtfP